MDLVWLVLDSVGFTHTSFAPDGPATTPDISTLADEHGRVFTRAYAPGPASPSSHGSMLTGALPSQTGMTEAQPFFDGETLTVPEALSDTHTTYLTSVNPFLFNGLAAEFDSSDDLARRQYMIFTDAEDPRAFAQTANGDTTLERLVELIARSDRPFRSLVNAMSYKYWDRFHNEFIPDSVAGPDGAYKYAVAINEQISSELSAPSDSFILANYMDAHPPFDVSESVLSDIETEYDRSELPVGVRAEDTDEYDNQAMETLYRASIRELDSQVAPLVDELVDQGTFVVVTADHGPRFGRRNYLTEERLHVPLVLFGPGVESETIEHTVSLRSLARTTAMAATGSDLGFDGVDLRSVEKDQIAETEYIHHNSGDVGPVNPYGSSDEARYDLRLRFGEATLAVVDGAKTEARGSETVLEELRERAKMLRARSSKLSGDDVEYGRETEQRLEDLGYL